MEAALKWPRMMPSSDVTPAKSEDILSNPNLSGTFSRMIGHYARDRALFPLSEALAKSSLYPAQWLEDYAPAFKKKGRIQVGMDADIVIFDYDEIAPRSDYGNPYQPSSGIRYVIVDGIVVVDSDAFIDAVHPGRHILAQDRE